MKKLYSLFASTLLVAASASAAVTLPYESGSFTESPSATVSEDGWSQCDKGGSSSWSSAGGAFKHNGNSAMTLGASADYGASDDWLISPQFAATLGNEYTVTFFVKSRAAMDVEAFDVCLTPTSPIDDADVAKGSPSLSAGTSLTTTYTETTVTLTATHTGPAYIAFHVVGQQSTNIYIADVKIEETVNENPVNPGPENPDTPEQPGDHECAGLQLPYASPIALSSTALDEAWTVINANNDSETWKAYSGTSSSTNTSAFANGCAAGVKYVSSNDGNDWLVSPALHMEAGKEYVICYGYKTHTDPETVTVRLSESKDVDAMLAGVELAKYTDKHSDYKKYNISYTPAKTGDYYVSYHFTSPKNKWYAFVGDFAVMENVFAPQGVSGLAAVVAPDRELKISLLWTLPTKSVFGEDFTEDQKVEKVEVYRDGGDTPIATLAGDAVSFDDTEATGLTSGKHSYSVVVTVAGVVSPAVSVGPTAYAGPLMPAAIPAEFPVSSADEFNNFTHLQGEGSTVPADKTWKFDTANSQGTAHLTAPYNALENDWLITPPVAVAAPGYYRVSVDGYIDNATSPFGMDAYVGRSTDVADMEFRAPIALVTRLKYEEPYTFDFYAPEAGTYYVGLRAHVEARSAVQHYYIRSVRVDASSMIPAPVTGLASVPAADLSLKTELSWTCPAADLGGVPMTADAYKIEVLLGGEPVATLDGGTSSYTLEVAEAGSYDVTVRTVGTDGATAAEHPTVSTGWIGSPVVALPYAIDFAKADATADIWSGVDANADDRTWVRDAKYMLLQSPANTVGAYMNWDDYLLSPHFELAPGYYTISFELEAGSWNTSFYFVHGLAKAGEFTADSKAWAGTPSKGKTEKSIKVAYSSVVKVDEAGSYQFVFGTDEYQSKLSDTYLPKLHSFSIESLPILPALATDVTVLPGADMALEATVSWTNPTATNIAGVELAEGDIVMAIIYRDGEEAGSVTDGLIPGEQSSFTDTTVDTPGSHLYKVELYTEGGRSAEDAVEVKSEWIGGGLEAPYEANADNFGEWTIDNVDNDTNNWGDPLTWIPKSVGLSVTVSSKNANDWATSPKLNVEENCIYKIEVTARHNMGWSQESSFDVYAGNSLDYDKLSKLGTVVLPSTATNDANAVVAEFYVMGAQPELVPPVEEGGEEGGDAPEVQSDETGEGETTEPAEPELPGENDLEARSIKLAPGVNSISLYANTKCDTRVTKVAFTLAERIETGLDRVVAEGMTLVDGKLLFAGKADVTVYDLAGALVAAERGAEGVCDLSTLNAGVYIVRIAVDGKATTIKLAL